MHPVFAAGGTYATASLRSYHMMARSAERRKVLTGTANPTRQASTTTSDSSTRRAWEMIRRRHFQCIELRTLVSFLQQHCIAVITFTGFLAAALLLPWSAETVAHRLRHPRLDKKTRSQRSALFSIHIHRSCITLAQQQHTLPSYFTLCIGPSNYSSSTSAWAFQLTVHTVPLPLPAGLPLSWVTLPGTDPKNHNSTSRESKLDTRRRPTWSGKGMHSLCMQSLCWRTPLHQRLSRKLVTSNRIPLAR